MKRLFDLVLVVPSLILMAPFMGLIAVLVWISMGRPVFFRQQRPGKGGKPFEMYKFRTMLDKRDGAGTLLPDEARITWIGRLLRSTSLDELPELFNVLKGDMSLVGPRPLLMQYLDRYTPEQARRHEVKPGLTGWAQVNGRNAITWEEKFRLDVWYVDHRSLLLDLKIIAMTVLKVIRREGISEEGRATMSEFNPQRTAKANTKTM
jgi:lipopolysaccharide/colanic/teichoic acid biosynthesis glycosyltransferase